MIKAPKTFFRNSCIAFICAIFFIFPVTTFGATATIEFGPGWGGGSFTVTTNKDVYAPGESITLTRTFINSPLSNSVIDSYYFLTTPITPLDTFVIENHANNVPYTATTVAPNNPGSYSLSFDVGDFCTNFSDCPIFMSSNTLNFTVAQPGGTVSVSSNISASWTISGPPITDLEGSGTYQEYLSQPTGTYTITWGDVAGYTTPASQSLSIVNSGDIINFSGNYEAQI